MPYISSFVWLTLFVLHLHATDTPLNVCATVPDLGALVRDIGGDQVEVTVFAKSTEDPHVIEARPSFVKKLSEADLLIQSGLELEIGWVPVLLKNARNARILPGALGFLDTSSAITPLDIPSMPVERSQGDVHPNGNPHYLSDPLSGLLVAKLMADRLGELRPARAVDFRRRYQDFANCLCTKFIGPELAQKYDPIKLVLLAQRGGLHQFLAAQGDQQRLAGWLGELVPYAGRSVVADHNLWPYLSQTFGFHVIGFLEPKPGISPTSRHLGVLIAQMQTNHVSVILTTPVFDPRHAAFVAGHTGAQCAAMAHQVGAQPGTDDYLAFVDYNVAQLAKAFAAR